jgi:hypothetical protein
MITDLRKLQELCSKRGDLPKACNGCPANMSTTEDRYETIIPRCRLLIPRAWNVALMEQAAEELERCDTE